MKAKLTGPVECLLCHFTGQPKDLKEEHDGLLVKCPECGEVLMNFMDGNFTIQNIKAESMSLTG